MTVTEKTTDKYIYGINGRTLCLEKDLVDRYSGMICPVDEEYILYLIEVYGKDGSNDSVLSYGIECEMARELSGYEY